MYYCNKCGKEIYNSGHTCASTPNVLTQAAVNEARLMVYDDAAAEVQVLLAIVDEEKSKYWNGDGENMEEWEKLNINKLPEEFTRNYEFKSIKLGDNEKIFIRKRTIDIKQTTDNSNNEKCKDLLKRAYRELQYIAEGQDLCEEIEKHFSKNIMPNINYTK